MNLLLLEDDLVYAMHLRESLETDGWTVYHEVNAAAAKLTLEEQSVDAIICDMLIRGVDSVPKNEGGLTLMFFAQHRVKPRPIIVAMTGARESLNLLKLAESMQADRVMQKPVNVAELLDFLRTSTQSSVGEKNG